VSGKRGRVSARQRRKAPGAGRRPPKGRIAPEKGTRARTAPRVTKEGKLGVAPATIVTRSAEGAERLLFALRGLYRERLEREALDSVRAESVTVRFKASKRKER
jgi:hypothetical protein